VYFDSQKALVDHQGLSVFRSPPVGTEPAKPRPPAEEVVSSREREAAGFCSERDSPAKYDQQMVIRRDGRRNPVSCRKVRLRLAATPGLLQSYWCTQPRVCRAYPRCETKPERPVNDVQE
jgi:hypothetical protein